jgi:HK97 family phage major capsid protein
MGAYLDRLHQQYDEIRQGIDTVVNRAAEEKRDVTDEEQAQVDRDRAQLEQLQPAIQQYTELEENDSKRLELRSRVRSAPTLTRAAPAEPEGYDITREFASAGEYASTVHAAWVRKDPSAIEKLERATAHQTTTDNPGIIPKPIVGPLINTMGADRPLLASVANRPAPTGKFDRPRIDQHVAVDVQATEKLETASQEMQINPVPVVLGTYAGHLNISKQDIRWSQPSILQVVFDDFTRVYASRTDAAACTEFPNLVTQTATLTDWTQASIDAFLLAAQQAIIAATDGAVADTLWMSLDVWTKIAAVRNPTNNQRVYDLPFTGSGGNVNGFRPVVDRRFPASTLILGDSALAEVWEDLEGFLSVDEPSVLGQLVGYAGYMDFVVLQAAGFCKPLLVPAILGGNGGTRNTGK